MKHIKGCETKKAKSAESLKAAEEKLFNADHRVQELKRTKETVEY